MPTNGGAPAVGPVDVIGKLCASPAGGGACGLIEYLVGYAIAEKGATREQIAEALDGVYAEAEARADLGVGVIWHPTAGEGTRPSSILVRNCASFMTASLEIDADAARNPGVRSAALHFVWSWNTHESGRLTDAQVHTYVQEVLEKLGLSHHRTMSVVHRDTIVFDRDVDGSIRRDEQGNPILRDGNLHVHCAVGSVDPRLGLAYDRTGLHRRMAWAEREIELKHGLEHDRGLAVVQDAELETAHVRWADKHELTAWRAERREERLVRQERRSFEAYRRRDVSFQRYVDVTVGPRLRQALDIARQRGRTPEWATLHAVAARYGCEIGLIQDEVVVRDVGIGELRVANERERRELRASLKADCMDCGDIEERVAALESEHEKREANERSRKRESGESIPLRAALRDDLRDLPAYQSLDESERDIVERIATQPAIVLSDITAQSSTFTREDVDLWLATRISDPTEIERLGDLVVRHELVRVLSADTAYPLMTTTEIVGIEEQLANDATAIAATPSGVTAGQIRDAIARYETQRSAQGEGVFRLSAEQRGALECVTRGSLITIEGLPGVGKTTIQGVVRALGEITEREVVGLTLSQAAAERLESEAGFHCVNTARARILEEGHTPIIPHGGIVVLDEAAMVDSRANARILELARQRGSLVIEIGDVRQLQPIDFGSSFRIIRDASREKGTYCELRDIQRQKRDWHREAVAMLADAIAELDENRRLTGVRGALAILDQHGAIAWTADRDEAINTAIAMSLEYRGRDLDTLTMASDRDTVRHLAEEDRRRSALEGKGRRYITEGGIREFAVGDRLMFLENSLGKRGLGVRNGDRGVVVDTGSKAITVRLDGAQHRTITFSPQEYRSFDYANACTVHKAQGASIDAAVAVIERSASAELLFVAVSRSKRQLDIVVPRTAFTDVDDLAEHVAERLTLKTTTRTFDEVLQKTGGKQTMRVLNIEAQREAAPLRRVYDAQVVEPLRALQQQRMSEERERYARRKANIAASGIGLEERLEESKDALRDFRRAATAVYRDCKPQPFAQWLLEREQIRARGHATRQQTRSQAHDQADNLFQHAVGRAKENERHVER